MKRMNNKGVTLVELIVSFAIVGVAIVYFYQTISTVSKLYANSREATNDFANATYVLRLVDAKLDDLKNTYYSPSGKNIDLTKSDAQGELEDLCDKISATCSVVQASTDSSQENYHFYTINVISDGKTYKLYRRATMKVNVGTKIVVTYSDGTPSTTEYSDGVDCNANTCSYEEVTSNTVTQKNDFVMANEYTGTDSLSKSVTTKNWRIFKVCKEYKMEGTREVSKEHDGTFRLLGDCKIVDLPELADMFENGNNTYKYMIPYESGKSYENTFRCTGIFNTSGGEKDSSCGTRKIDPAKANFPSSGGSWLFRINDVNEGSLGIFIRVNWTRWRVKAQSTRTVTTTKYNVYAYED